MIKNFLDWLTKPRLPWWKRFAGFIVILLAVMIGQSWHVTFDPHPDNEALQVATRCEGKIPYYALQVVFIEPKWTSVDVHRSGPLPQESCSVTFELMRNPKHDLNPNNEYVGDIAVLTEG